MEHNLKQQLKDLQRKRSQIDEKYNGLIGILEKFTKPEFDYMQVIKNDNYKYVDGEILEVKVVDWHFDEDLDIVYITEVKYVDGEVKDNKNIEYKEYQLKSLAKSFEKYDKCN